MPGREQVAFASIQRHAHSVRLQELGAGAEGLEGP
jgi:hypothetical protein